MEICETSQANGIGSNNDTGSSDNTDSSGLCEIIFACVGDGRLIKKRKFSSALLF